MVMIDLYEMYAYEYDNGDWDLIRIRGHSSNGYYSSYDYELLAYKCRGEKKNRAPSDIQMAPEYGEPTMYSFAWRSMYSFGLKHVPVSDIPLYLGWDWVSSKHVKLFKKESCLS